MKKILHSAIILLGSFQMVHAQTKAITDNGREVVLYSNGTWKYSDSTTADSSESDSIKTNKIKIVKNAAETFLVKSKIVNIGIYINPGKWVFRAPQDNDVGPEYYFEKKDQTGFALLLSEKIQFDLPTLKDVALENAQRAAADAKVVWSEYRTVNNVKVLCLKMEGTLKGIKFAYLGYYYSNENGTVQLLSYTTEKQFEQTKKELEDFLNGFVVLDKK